MRERTLFADKIRKMIQQPSKTCPFLHPSISTCPSTLMREQEFNYEYLQFMRNLPGAEEAQDNIKYLFELYLRVCNQGGLVTVISDNKLETIISQMSIRFPEIKSLTAENVIEHYIKYELFSFQVVLKTGKRIQSHKLSFIKNPKIIQRHQLDLFLTDRSKGINIFDEDVTLLKDFCTARGLSQKYFTLQFIKERYGNETVSILIQDAYFQQISKNFKDQQSTTVCQNRQNCKRNSMLLLSSFHDSYEEIHSSILTQILFKQYCQYHQSNYFQSFEAKNRLSALKNNTHVTDETKKRVVMAFGLDPKDDFYTEEISKKLTGSLLNYHQDFDLLSYSDEDIPGVTLPNFQFLVDGNWSGGRQQPFGMARVDINFGPEAVQWFCISGESYLKINSMLLKEHKIGIDKINGKWFEDIDWFVEKDIPIKKINQHKGDAIIIGSQSAYWYKSKGRSVHAYWSTMPKSEKQIKAIARKINKTTDKLSCDSVPQKKIAIKALLLRSLNHEEPENIKCLKQQNLQIPCIVVVRDLLKKWYLDQQKELNHMTVRQDIVDYRFKVYPLFDAQSYCNQCQAQILNYFVNKNGVTCLHCAYKDLSGRQQELKDKTIYMKYQSYWICQLIFYGSSRQLSADGFFSEYAELCRGQHICNIKNCKKSLITQQNDDIAIVEESGEWSKQISEYYQQDQNEMQNLHLHKISSLLSRKITISKINTKIEKQGNGYMLKSSGVQTQMCMLEEQKKIDEPKRVQAAPTQNYGISKACIDRKNKRSMHREGSVESQVSNETQTNNSWGESRHGSKKFIFNQNYKEQEDKYSGSRQLSNRRDNSKYDGQNFGRERDRRKQYRNRQKHEEYNSRHKSERSRSRNSKQYENNRYRYQN